MWNYFFRVCKLNKTSVYLRLFDYVSDHNVPRSPHTEHLSGVCRQRYCNLRTH